MSGSTVLRFGYLVSQYPAISHTFILREVLALRKHGLEIEPASVNPPDRSPDNLTSDERTEAERTFYLKKTSPWKVLTALVGAFLHSPVRFFGAFAFSLRLGKTDARAIIYNCFYFVEAVLLADWMRKSSITHLHVHFATPAATVALILGRLAPISFSLTVHGPDEFYDVPGYYLSEKVAAARFVCVIGSYARSQMMKVSSPEHWSKIEIAPLGVDAELFQPSSFRSSPELFEVLCVGRLVPAKGQHILLQAASLLQKSGKSFLLRFVGDGPDRQSLEREAHQSGLANVRFEGSVNQDRIRQFYETADIFALASFAEGIPVVLMEAMAMEIPCVSTWIAGIPELIRHDVDGILVAPSSADELASAISRLMGDNSLRLRLGKAGRIRVLDRYQLRRNTDYLAGIFRRHLGTSS